MSKRLMVLVTLLGTVLVAVGVSAAFALEG